MSLFRSLAAPPTERAMSVLSDLSIDQVAAIMRDGFHAMPFAQSLHSPREEIFGDYAGLMAGILRANPIAFSAIVVRMQVFGQARYRFRRWEDGQPGQMFGLGGPTGDGGLRLLERPEPTVSGSDMQKRASMDADLAGNWFGVRRPGRIKRARPDWCYLVLGSTNPDGDLGDIDTEVLGMVHQPGGISSGLDPEAFEVGEYAHFAPIPDPGARYRGMSWLTPIIREVQADQLMTTHKLKFLEQGATPNLIVKLPAGMKTDKAQEWIDLFEQEHHGAYNAYRTIYLTAGFDHAVVGVDMQKMDFKAIQGASETRISVASRVPAVLLGISEGLQGSSLNSGNYEAAKRSFGETTMRDLWKDMASSLETIVPPPPGSSLWYDERWIPFLAADAKAAAEVLNLQVRAITMLWRDGADTKKAVEAVMSGDLNRIEHTGRLSVQLQEPGADPDAGDDDEDDDPKAAGDGAALLASGEIRCGSCKRVLAEMASAPYRFTCPRCKSVTEA